MLNKAEFIIATLAQYAGRDVTPDTPIAELGLDSIDDVEAVMDIEEELKVTIADDEFRKHETVAGFIRHCEGLTSNPC